MSKICSITNKKSLNGYTRSNSNHKTKKWFKANIFKKRIYNIKTNKWEKIKISIKGLRILKKKGLII
ncbi:MAG: 50S ribosomal protein L28 [Candidatus Shikimatogenerans bostrichidophilus]|nr:MAG: 50S ribosomal protein L28 [Candidatus Shikimatogenerans bostrichidophilus]